MGATLVGLVVLTRALAVLAQKRVLKQRWL
jgi:hypothetical protein